MLRRFFYVLPVLAIALWLWFGRSAPVDEQIPPGPHRILSLSPNITEIIYRLGLEEQLVGVTDFCRYPEAARSKAKIGGLMNPNLERMFGLEPTLAVMLPSHRELASQLAIRDVATLFVKNDTVGDVIESIETIGEATGRQAAATALADSIQTVIDTARETARRGRRWKTMVVVDRPVGSLTDIFVVGPGTYLDEVIEIVGGENVFGQALARYPQAGVEEVLFRNPEIIIEVRQSGVDVKGLLEKARRTWGSVPGLAAAESGRIYLLAGDHLLVPGPRIGMTIQDFSDVLAEVR